MIMDFLKAINYFQKEEDMPMSFIEEMIRKAIQSAYKKMYHHFDNLHVYFSSEENENQRISIFVEKIITENPKNLEREIDPSDPLCKDKNLGQTVMVPFDSSNFNRDAILAARSVIYTILQEYRYRDFKDKFQEKIGQLVSGYLLRRSANAIYLNIGKTEAIIPNTLLSPLDKFELGDKIRALVVDIRTIKDTGQMVLSRTHLDFVRKLLEEEIPEIRDKIIKIERIARIPGFRTKIAVSSERSEIDPVGAVLGLRAIRLKSILDTLNGEKVDIVHYSNDIATFVANIFSSFEVLGVHILDTVLKKILVIISDEQLALAIGKSGHNIKLASRLSDWLIVIKNLQNAKAENLISEQSEYEQATMEFVNFLKQQDIPERIIHIFLDNKIQSIEELKQLDKEALLALHISETLSDKILSIVTWTESSLVQDDEKEIEFEEEESEILLCPNCEHEINLDMKTCAHCGVELVFEFE